MSRSRSNGRAAATHVAESRPLNGPLSPGGPAPPVVYSGARDPYAAAPPSLRADAASTMPEIPAQQVTVPLYSDGSDPSLPVNAALGGDFVAAHDANLTAAQQAALQSLLWRVKVLVVVHLLAMLLMCYTRFWYAVVVTYLGFLCVLVYWHLYRLERAKAIAVLLVVTAASWLAVIAVIIFYMAYPFTKLPWDLYLAVCVLIPDAIFVVPATLYTAFWLHRSYSITHISF